MLHTLSLRDNCWSNYSSILTNEPWVEGDCSSMIVIGGILAVVLVQKRKIIKFIN